MVFRRRIVWLVFCVMFTAVFTACFTSQVLKRNPRLEIPDGFPKVIFPSDNEYTADRWILGKKLFYEKALSLDNSISCSSCHRQELAFSDDVAFSKGSAGAAGTRNAPSLGNVAYHPYYTRDGGVPTLEMQVLVPVQEHNEFNTNILVVADKLKTDSGYSLMSRVAYGREMDYYVITRALATFERSLLSGNSRYDHKRLSPVEKKGKDLFFSKRTGCANCHDGFNFTNYAFENTGLYENYKDIGRKRLTGKVEDLEMFKVPSLRNVALTSPYMHDGSLSTLEQVVEHYNSGGKNNPRKNMLIKELGLTETEKKELVAFLKSLTDDRFVSNTKFNNEN
jgi:cytochrome c peroxidase